MRTFPCRVVVAHDGLDPHQLQLNRLDGGLGGLHHHLQAQQTGRETAAWVIPTTYGSIRCCLRQPIRGHLTILLHYHYTLTLYLSRERLCDWPVGLVQLARYSEFGNLLQGCLTRQPALPRQHIKSSKDPPDKREPQTFRVAQPWLLYPRIANAYVYVPPAHFRGSQE